MTLALKLAPHLGLKSGAVVALTPAQLVAADLAGTTGFTLNPADTANLDQSSGGGSPVVSAADPVGRFTSINGTTTYTFQQATAAARPAWQTTYLDYDFVDDNMDNAASYGFSASLSGETITARVRPANLAVAQTVFLTSGVSATNTRRRIQILTTGAVALFSRRADGDGGTTVSSAAGVIVAGSAYTIQTRIRFNGGADEIEILVNGVSVATGTQGGTANAVSDAASSARARLGANAAASPGELMRGRIGRLVYMRAYASAGQLTNHAAYVAEVAI